MKIYATWILIFTIVKMVMGRDSYDHDFEIFHTDDHNAFRSQSLYPSPDIKSSDYYINGNNDNNENDGNNYNDDDAANDDYSDNSHNIHRRFTEYRIGQLPRITAEQEKISNLPLYISPDEVSHRLVRSPQSPGHRDYIHNYKEFLEKHFSRAYDEAGAGGDTGKNAKYQNEQSDNVNDKDDYRDEDDRHHYKSEQQQDYGGGGGGSRYNNNNNNNKNDNGSGGHLRSSGTAGGHKNNDDAEIYHYPSTSSGQHTDNYNDEYERIKKLSQEQEKTIQKDPKNCKTEIRGDMKCSVCIDPKSGDNSESCSYSAEPTDKKYAYTRERNYDSKDDDDNNKNNDNDQKSSKKNSEYKPLKTNNKSSKLKQAHESTITATSTTATTSATTETPTRYQRLRSRRPKATQSTSHLSSADVELTSLYPNNNNNNQQKSAALKQQGRRSNGGSLKPQNPQPYRDENKKFRSSYKAEESRPQRDVIGLDPFLYGGGGGGGSSNDNTHHNYRNHNDNDNNYQKNSDNDDNTRSQRLRSYEDYFSHVFPESKYSAKQPIYDEPEHVEIISSSSSSSYKNNNNGNNGGANGGNNGNDYDDGNDQTKNVASVLADFKQRDWSTCQKSKKGDLTCYNCKDDKGVKHEECMYESSSNPSKSRLAYTELKEYHENDNDDNNNNNNKNRNNNDHSNYRRDSANDSSDLIASIHGDDEKINENKSNENKRAAIIRKRTVTSNNGRDKIAQPLKSTTASSVSNDDDNDDEDNSAPPKPEDIQENQSGQKRTFKRTVSYRIEKNDETDPNKSKIMVFEHKYSQVA